MIRPWLKQRADVTPRTVRRLTVAAIATTLLLFAWLLWLIIGLADEQAAAEAQLTRQAVAIARADTTNARQDSALTEANERLVSVGEQPVAPPPVPRGIPGTDGLNGADGLPGVDGDDGAPGADGKDGATGPAGPAGPPGADGATGPAGSDGKDGKDGATGPEGPPGPAGDDGADGASAYPFTFTFTVPPRNPAEESLTYTCTVTEPGAAATCTT